VGWDGWTDQNCTIGARESGWSERHLILFISATERGNWTWPIVHYVRKGRLIGPDMSGIYLPTSAVVAWQVRWCEFTLEATSLGGVGLGLGTHCVGAQTLGTVLGKEDRKM